MRRFLALAVLLSLLACQSPSGQVPASQAGTLETADGISIAYSYLPGSSGKGVILLHMLGRSKEDYAYLAQQLNNAGLAVIAIDFRGHGKSAGDMTKFSDADYQKFVLDVKAAKQFLAQQGVGSVGIVGASIGANAALNYAANDPDVKALVLLSPGMNYHGVDIAESAKRYPGYTLLVAAADDDYSANTVRKLMDIMHAKSQKMYTVGSGHGTGLFKKTNAEHVAADWLNQYLVSARLL